MEIHFPTSHLTSSQSQFNYFRWGGTLTAIFLLILNRAGRRSCLQTSLLVVYLFSSLPVVIFNILRGQFGAWVAFLAVAAHLFFPETFSASRFLLFVITPRWVAHALRNSIVGCSLSLVLAVCLVVEHIQGTRDDGGRNCCGGSQRFSFLIGVFLLLLFPALDLWTGS